MSTNDFTDGYKRKIDSMQTLYRFKGAVDTIADLSSIEEVTRGDVYKCNEDENDYIWNGQEWVNIGKNIDFSTLIDNQTIKQSIKKTSQEIPENTNYTIPLPYKVGNHSLEIYYQGEKLVEGEQYIEVGSAGEISVTIQWHDWGQSVPAGRTIEYVVRGDYSE